MCSLQIRLRLNNYKQNIVLMQYFKNIFMEFQCFLHLLNEG